MISSNKIHRLRQIDYIPVTQFQGLSTGGTVFLSVGAGGPIFKEIGASGINGLLTDDANDEVSHFMRIPSNWDRDNNIYVRFIYATKSDVAADVITWKFLYGLFNPGTDLLAAPATALDTPLVQETITGVDLTLERSNVPGVLNGGTIPDADLYWAFTCIELLETGITEDIYFMGVEFEYTVKQDRGNLVSEPETWEA